MKKLIAILAIAIVLVGAVFAATGDQLTITSTVSKHEPAFRIYGSESAISSSNAGTLGTPSGAAVTFATTKDISATSITVYCRVSQYSIKDGYNTPKSKFKGIATIGVVATPLTTTLTGTNDAGTYSTPATASVTTSDAHVPTGTPARVTTTTFAKSAATGSSTDNKVDIVWSYSGKSVDDADVYADFSFTWAQDDSLPPGTYTADITMTYTVV